LRRFSFIFNTISIIRRIASERPLGTIRSLRYVCRQHSPLAWRNGPSSSPTSPHVESGEHPVLFGIEPPRPRIEAIRIVDMSSSNSWAEFAALFRNTRGAFLDHERAKAELKTLMPEDAREAFGHGVRAKRSKSGAVSFDVVDTEATRAAIQ